MTIEHSVGEESPGRLEIVSNWRQLNAMLIDLVDLVPDDQMEWSPKPALWSFRHIFQHVSEAREQWMTRAINDGESNMDVYADVHSRDEIKDALRRTWERVERTLTNQSRLDATYRDQWWADAPLRNGHWVAFHLLEHDVHHRADVFLYLALLGIETPQVSTP